MAKRRFEMYHYRQALVRMRLGDSDRQIAQSGLMGRRVAATVRGEAAARGWLSKLHFATFAQTLRHTSCRLPWR